MLVILEGMSRVMLLWASSALCIAPTPHARAANGSQCLLPSHSPGIPPCPWGKTHGGRSSSKQGQPWRFGAEPMMESGSLRLCPGSPKPPSC